MVGKAKSLTGTNLMDKNSECTTKKRCKTSKKIALLVTVAYITICQISRKSLKLCQMAMDRNS